MAEPRALPGWPPVLHEAWAAAYVSLSPATFRAKVAPDVPPISLTERRIGWLRADLDKWIAQRVPGHEALENYNPWDED